MADAAVDIAVVEREDARAESARSLMFLLFFVSGFAALQYQIVWQRALFAIYGTNVESVTVVVSAFMLGLGLGSLAGGYVSTLGVPLIPVFGAAELGTAVFGFISLRLFNAVAVHTAGSGTFVTGILAFVLVLIPTMLMGSTLPVLVTYCVRTVPNMGRWTGGLYYVNTLGAAVACIVAASFTMRAFGESGCVYLAACVNTIVGGTALAYHFFREKTDHILASDFSEPVSGEHQLLPFSLGVVLAGASGVIALAYEIIWYRVFSFATAGNAKEFAYVLGMYLNGIAFGALIAERISRSEKGAQAQRRMTGAIIVAGNLVAFAIAPLASYMVRALRIPNLAFLLVSVGALLLGAVLPLTCHLTIRPDTKAGSGLSQLYFSNIIGSVIGSYFVGYVLMDFMSTAQVSLLLVICGIVLGLVVLAWRDAAQTKLVVALAAVCVVAVGGVWRLFPGMWARLLPAYQGAQFEYLIENRSGVVGVLTDKTVIGGGAYDGRFNTDPVQDTNGIFRAYALSALHPAPKNVLMIGLSSGSWAQVLANNPSLEHLTIIEINPGYLSLIPRYEEVRSVLTNPRVTIVIDDGRRWLRRHPEKFDAVVMNTTFHWRANVSNLLSAEFLQLVRQHLKPGGILYYNTTSSPEVQLTGATIFPYLVRVWTFVAVSDSPIVVDKQRWIETMQRYSIDGRPLLEPMNAGANQALLDNYAKWVDGARGDSDKQIIEYADTLRARYKGRDIVTDDNMACEWRD